MKRAVRVLLLLFFITFMSFALSSCSAFDLEYGDFIIEYDYSEKEVQVMIYGLSESGRKKETIVIPSMLDGKKVSKIGHPKKELNSTIQVSSFQSEKLKNLYIPAGYMNSSLDVDFYAELSNVKNVYWGDDRYLSSYCYAEGRTRITFVSQKNFDEYSFYLDANGNKVEYMNFKVANVCYYFNDGTDSGYFVDYVNEGKINVIPPTPYRQGYEFIGWYKDKEATTKWDFDNDIVNPIVLEGNTEVFEETKIYAGWELKNEKEIY